ncbi:tryptophan halogenase family protein [Simiduia aestuariiviva]|uniref:Glycine/D-amino acid oxidase-like deaminating enzyme n=1 Tax=Simiduia aestuariiviva TaxID=1510459 RepID=A0A839UHM7_9GAMM|nr:tryptophan halogenase family protein [Simiduia aestuariiviva]MBB3167362.1 glycine/D-amino acid oxidase-like deaminating enzyme [Simiduia aestuariiviva]
MSGQIKNIVIVGGGSAGWLTAGLIASEQGSAVTIALVESPDIPAIGVGEGTWPSMRMTLQRIGISETTFIRECDASFKQGTRFVDWQGGNGPQQYTHPFSLPLEYASLNLASHWLRHKAQASDAAPSFAEFVTPQAAVAAQGLAPKQAATPEYAFNLNYGYHLDATRFADLLRKHVVETLGVKHIQAHVVDIESASNGDVAALRLDNDQHLAGDLFIDCSGAQSLLIGKHFETPFTSLKNTLFNDRALAVQVPYPSQDAPIASTTVSTALPDGWVWDIALQSRRGVGYVYSSAHADEDKARSSLANYLRNAAPEAGLSESDFRALRFSPGHYQQLWVNNCVAIGMAGGFIEPLEASALAMVEQGAALLADQLPANRAVMDVVAQRFNEKMAYHWRAIVDFLKLHYLLSERDDSQYWRDSRSIEYCSESLRARLALWHQQSPWHDDAPRIDELFPSASYQYVLYGMGFQPANMNYSTRRFAQSIARANRIVQDNRQRVGSMLTALPTNRELINHIIATGMPR